MLINGIDFTLAMSIAERGCSICGKRYIEGDDVIIEQNIATRTGTSRHRGCLSAS